MKQITILLGSMMMMLSACFAHDPKPSEDSAETLAFCQAVATYVASHYVSTTTASQPFSYDNASNEDGFVALELPSLYDVLYQHKGYDSVVAYCLERHSMT